MTTRMSTATRPRRPSSRARPRAFRRRRRPRSSSSPTVTCSTCASPRWPSSLATRRCGCSPTTARFRARRCSVQQGSSSSSTCSTRATSRSTVHWHGLRLDNRFDGTHETQAPIPVGGRFTYRLEFPDPGVYWYHPHIREDYGQELGLYGNIVVVPGRPGLLAAGQPRARADAGRRPDRGRPHRAVQPTETELRRHGPLRQRLARRRRTRPRAGRAARAKSCGST